MQQNAEAYLDDIIKIIDICFSAVYELLNTDKDVDYAEDLKIQLIELYSCIGFAINNKQQSNWRLFEHFGNLATFIVRTCDKNINPTVVCFYL